MFGRKSPSRCDTNSYSGLPRRLVPKVMNISPGLMVKFVSKNLFNIFFSILNFYIFVYLFFAKNGVIEAFLRMFLIFFFVLWVLKRGSIFRWCMASLCVLFIALHVVDSKITREKTKEEVYGLAGEYKCSPSVDELINRGEGWRRIGKTQAIKIVHGIVATWHLRYTNNSLVMSQGLDAELSKLHEFPGC